MVQLCKELKIIWLEEKKKKCFLQVYEFAFVLSNDFDLLAKLHSI